VLTEKLCEAAVSEGKTLAQALRDDPAGKAMSAKDLDALFDPESCYGSAPAMIERALAEWSHSTTS
jgi:adenylosuccinate lyase